jgi:hypothetical protein
MLARYFDWGMWYIAGFYGLPDLVFVGVKLVVFSEFELPFEDVGERILFAHF